MSHMSTGEQFPNLMFETYSGKKMQISEAIKGKKYSIFWMMRYIGCRLCQCDLDLLAEQYDRFMDANAQVFAVVQSRKETIRKLKGEYSVPFEIICDTKHEFYEALDVKATATREDRMPKDAYGKEKHALKMQEVESRHYGKISGDGEEVQQLPALFIVNEEGKLIYIHYAEYTVDIPDIDEMIKLLDGLNLK